MSVNFLNNNSAYGFNEPLTPVINPPIVAQRAPTNQDLAPIGTQWLDQLAGNVYFLVSVEGAIADWVAAAGNAIDVSSLTIDPGPFTVNGQTLLNGNIDSPGVITLEATGGVTSSIVIESVSGTASDSVGIFSTLGGIEVTTAGAAGDIAITATDGRVTIDSGENIANSIALTASGGALSGITLQSTNGTGAGSVKIDSTLGGIEIINHASAKDIQIQSVLGTLTLEAGENSPANIFIQSSGGTSATMVIENTTGTTAATVIAGSSLEISSTAGGVGIDAGKDFHLAGVDSSIVEVSGVNKDLLVKTTDGSIFVTANGANGTIELVGNAGTAGDIILDATTAGGGIQLSAGTGGMLLESTEAAANAIELHASGAAGGITLLAGNNGISETTNGAILISSSDGLSSAVTISATGAGGGVVIAPTSTTVAVAIGDVAPTVNRTTTINAGVVATAVTDTLNLGVSGVSTNAGAAKVVNVMTGANLLGSQTLNIATGTAASGTKTVNIGNADGLTAINELGVVHVNTSGAGATTIGTTATGGNVSIASAGTIILDSADALSTAVVVRATGAGGGISIAPTATTAVIDMGNVIPTVARTTTINGGAVGSAVADTLNLASGVTTFAGATKVVNIATGSNTLGATSVNIATGTTASGTKAVSIGNSTDALTAVNIYGVAHVNTTGTGATTIGNAAAGGAIALTTNTAVSVDAKTASHFTVTGAADLTVSSSGGNVVVSGGAAASNAIQLTCANAGGGILATVGTGNFNVAAGNISLSTAAKGLVFQAGPSIVSGAGSPNGAVTAAKGSLFLSTSGSGVNDRMFINTDGVTAWTAVVTVA